MRVQSFWSDLWCKGESHTGKGTDCRRKIHYSSPEVRRVMYSGGIELFTGDALSGDLPSSLVSFLLTTQGSLQWYSQFW